MALALFPVWSSLARVKVGVSHGHWHGCFWLEAMLVWASPESKPSTRIWIQVVYVEKEMATHSSTLAGKTPWTEKPGGLYSPWGRTESDTTVSFRCTVYVGMLLGSRMWEEAEEVKKKTKIMVHFQSHCIGNRCLILLGSPKRQSKIRLQELCFQKTKDWDTYFLARIGWGLSLGALTPWCL